MEDRARTGHPGGDPEGRGGHFHIKTMELKSRNNSKHISFPRQVAMYLCKRLTDKSLPAIGSGLRREAPHDGHSRRPQDRGDARARQRSFARVLSGLQESFK